jgi:hypothetical protein
MRDSYPFTAIDPVPNSTRVRAQGHRSQVTGHRPHARPRRRRKNMYMGGPIRAQDVVCIRAIDTRCCVKNKKSYPQIILK